MTDEEAYIIQACGGLLEFAMATYEGLIHVKRASVSELRRHKSVIRDSFVELGPDMLRACEHAGSRQLHPRWRMNIRVKELLKDLLLHEATPAAVIDRYLEKHEEYRARLLK
jgi:hypothetical protein